MVALDLGAIRYLGYGNFGGPRKNFFQCAVVTGIQMLQKDKSHARGFRQIGQQGREGFKATSGGAHTNHREELLQGGSISVRL